MSISPLRQRMIDDMTARHFGEKAQRDYIRCVKNLAAFLGRSPETADLEDLRRFRLHLIESSLSVSSVNMRLSSGVLKKSFGGANAEIQKATVPNSRH